jgi:AraC-like DNA-binding protein
MYCPAQTLASTGVTEHALERHNLLCPRQDYTRSNLSETITLVDSSRLAGLTASTSRGHFARAPGILLFGMSAICGLRKQRDACRKEAQSITAVALDCGFSHAQHFIAAFRRVTGLTPLDVPPCLSLSESNGEATMPETERWAESRVGTDAPAIEVRIASVSHHEGHPAPQSERHRGGKARCRRGPTPRIGEACSSASTNRGRSFKRHHRLDYACVKDVGFPSLVHTRAGFHMRDKTCAVGPQCTMLASASRPDLQGAPEKGAG